jgi:hypothetical protein
MKISSSQRPDSKASKQRFAGISLKQGLILLTIGAASLPSLSLAADV